MDVIPQTIFREYQPKQSMRSDRSAGDRARHRQKIKSSIKDNISDIIADESIIGKSGDKIIKVPIKGIKEFRFVYGDNKGVGTGNGNAQPGQVVGKNGQQEGQGQKGKGGDQAGEDVYETEITLDELLDYLFEELQLPNLKKTNLKEIIQKSKLKKDGYRRVGIQVRLDRFKTAKERIKRKKAMERHGDTTETCENCEGFGINLSLLVDKRCEECNGTGKVDKRVRYRNEDRRYKHMDVDPKPQSNAAIIFVMDTSGSMGTEEKFLARSFFFLLHAFIKARYERSELVFISHSTEAQEVNEDQFFHKGESGGTMISSGLKKAVEIINSRYNPTIWNNYIWHMSDGDNFDSDNPAAVKAMKELCTLSSLVGYGEIKPNTWSSSSIMSLYETELKGIENYKAVKITSKNDIWPKLKEILSIENDQNL